MREALDIFNSSVTQLAHAGNDSFSTTGRAPTEEAGRFFGHRGFPLQNRAFSLTLPSESLLNEHIPGQLGFITNSHTC